MTLDKKTLDMLLALDDQRLTLVIKKLAADAGIASDAISIGPNELKGIRTALSMASDGDIALANQLIQNFKNGNKG